MNAEELAAGLRRPVDGAPSEAAAVEHFRSYVQLLRQAASDDAPIRARRFAFKLELDDGRWNLDEKLLAVPPRAGDVVSFNDGRRWRVRTSQVVGTRPAGKLPREVFVCAPAG